MALLDPERPEEDYALFDDLSASFLRGIKAHYDRDTAAQAMDALMPILGKEWRNRLIFGIVAAEIKTSYTRVQIRRVMADPVYQKINAIKEVRSLSGMGLTEAKSTVENADYGSVVFEVRAKPDHYDKREWEQSIIESIKSLKTFGFQVSVV